MRIPTPIQLTLVLLAYALAVGVGYCYFWPANYDAISAWAVSLTGGVVLWYTWETMQLRRVAYLQREAQLRPFILFRRHEGRYVIENVGNGTALNISIDKVLISAELEMEIRFPETVSFLQPNAVVEFKTESYTKGRQSDDAFTAHLDPKYASLSLDIRIHFSNVEGRRYSLVETVTPGTLEITGFRDEAAL